MKKASKLLALALSAVMTLGLAGCGGNTTTSSNASKADGSSSGTTSEVKAMPAVAKDKIKIGVIHIGDPADGAGYSFAHDQGIQAMKETLGLRDDQIINKINIPDEDVAATRTAIEECIEEGCHIIFGTSFNYMNTMEELANEHKDVIFSHATGYKNNGVNMNNYFGRIYQARYLAGIAAGMRTESKKIGYVAAMDIQNSEVTGGINAFAMGVKSVNPDAKVYVKVTNTWFDVTKEKQAAEALLAMGCDVIAQHCDTTAPQLAAEEQGKWGCGYNSDMTPAAPKAHLTAPIWNWGVYYTTAVQEVIDGKWKPVNYFGGMAEGFVGVSPLSENCVEGTQAKIDEVSDKIKDGSFKVFEGELKDNQGNVVCKEGEVISDADITGHMNWYFENVEVK